MESDPIEAHVSRKELGRLERRVPLTGELVVEGGGPAPVELCLTSRGLWIVAAQESRGLDIDLLSRADVHYERQRRRDRLIVGDQTLEVPTGRAEAARAALAIGRLRGKEPPSLRPLFSGRYVEGPTDVERAAILSALEPDELLLSHLRTDMRRPLVSTLSSEPEDSAVRFVMTDRRALLLTVSELGDCEIEVLAQGAVEAVAAGRGEISIANDRVRFAKNEPVMRELFTALRSEPQARLFEAARLNWRSSNENRLASTRALLANLARYGDVVAVVAQFMVAVELEEPVASRPSLADVGSLDDRQSGRAVANLWRDWGLSLEAGRAALDELRKEGSTRSTFELHRALRQEALERHKDPVAAAIVDVEFVEHALSIGAKEEIVPVLEQRLGELPPHMVGDVAFSSPAADATRTVRTRLTELLVEARSQPGEPDLEALAELVKLEPLVRERAEALAGVAHGNLAERAATVAKVLGAGALCEVSSTEVERTLSPLADELLESRLPSPVSSDSAAVLSALQTMVATSGGPDFNAIRSYCAPLSSAGQAVVRALDAARVVLRMGEVEAFVSRGTKDVGIRAYEGKPAVLLVGGRHVDTGPHHMTAGELRFAFGAEVAHLRYSHNRVTVESVWEGALSMSRQGIDVLLGVLPMLSGFKAAGRFGRVVSQLDAPTVRRALKGASALNETLRRALSTAKTNEPNEDVSGIAHANERLIFAHRLMQLTTDRAGLVVAGDLHSAIRAMFLVRRELFDALSRSENESLAALLEARIEARELAFYDLALRIAALIGFFLSEDYVTLRGAVAGD